MTANQTSRVPTPGDQPRPAPDRSRVTTEPQSRAPRDAEIEELRAELERWKARAHDQLGKRIEGLGFGRCPAAARVASLTERLARVEAYAQSHAISAHALGRTDNERKWLDLLAILERAALADPADDEARCQHVSPSPWGATQCALPLGHDERHAYSPSESLDGPR